MGFPKNKFSSFPTSNNKNEEMDSLLPLHLLCEVFPTQLHFPVCGFICSNALQPFHYTQKAPKKHLHTLLFNRSLLHFHFFFYFLFFCIYNTIRFIFSSMLQLHSNPLFFLSFFCRIVPSSELQPIQAKFLILQSHISIRPTYSRYENTLFFFL